MTVPVHTSLAERAYRRPMAADVRRRLEADLHIVFRMLNRSPWIREFILSSNPTSDLLMLLSPLGAQSSFILDTEEHQQGRLTGSISLRYLMVPSFSTPEGLSGGAVVTTYSRRNHPLHAPSVMANTRMGRYVRDNATGEWLILTRNELDNVTRLQWLHSSKSTTRERICLTCNTELFNKGMFVDSMLFECHDEEWRPCPQCHAPPEACCECSTLRSALPLPKHPLDLPTAAAAALGEPKSEWFGRVQVSILSNYRDLRGDVDACMNLRTSFEASQDANLALQMQNLALAERAKSAIPKHLPSKMLNEALATQEHRAIYPQHAATEQQSLGMLAPSLISGCNGHTATPIRQQNGVQIEMLTGQEKMLSIDAAVSELNAQADDDKLFANEQLASPAGIAISGVTNASEHGAAVGCSFDPMSMLVAKHDSTNGNHVNETGRNVDSNGVIPNGHSVGVTPQQVQRMNRHYALVMEGLGANGFTPDIVHQAQSKAMGRCEPTVKTQHQEENEEEEDEEGVFNSAHDRQRMPSTKSFDSLLGNLMTPHATTSNDTIESMDLGENGWLNGATAHTNGLSKQVATPERPQDTRPHSAPVRERRSRPRTNADKTLNVPAAPRPVMGVYGALPNGGRPCSGRTGVAANGCGTIDDGDLAPLARLKPRPPGMVAGADGTWLWHPGLRGPMGWAAIAAARQRERRAEERRRKNREAAARSNARSKERIAAIKGEVEKNKERIARLGRKRKELEVQNCALKLRLTQRNL